MLRAVAREEGGWSRFSEDLRSPDRPSGDTVFCYLFSCECLGDDGRLYPKVFPGLLNPSRESRPILSGLTALHTIVRIVAWRDLSAPAERMERAPVLPANPDWRSVRDELPEREGEFVVKSVVLMGGIEPTWEIHVEGATFRRGPEGADFFSGGKVIPRVVAWAPLPEQQGGNVR
jgi:hypothetical protein